MGGGRAVTILDYILLQYILFPSSDHVTTVLVPLFILGTNCTRSLEV